MLISSAVLDSLTLASAQHRGQERVEAILACEVGAGQEPSLAWGTLNGSSAERFAPQRTCSIFETAYIAAAYTHWYRKGASMAKRRMHGIWVLYL